MMDYGMYNKLMSEELARQIAIKEAKLIRVVSVRPLVNGIHLLCDNIPDPVHKDLVDGFIKAPCYIEPIEGGRYRVVTDNVPPPEEGCST